MPFDGISKTTGAGKPAAIDPTGAKGFGALNWLVCLTGKLKACLLSGKGIPLAPSPARTTVLSVMRYEAPLRSAKFFHVPLTPTFGGTLPYPATRSALSPGL